MTNYKVCVELNETGAMIAGKKTRTIDLQSEYDDLDLSLENTYEVIRAGSMGPYIKQVRSVKRFFMYESGKLFAVIFPDACRYLARCISSTRLGYDGTVEIIEGDMKGTRIEFATDGSIRSLANAPVYIENFQNIRLTNPTAKEMDIYNRKVLDNADAQELMTVLRNLSASAIDQDKMECKVYSMSPVQINSYLKQCRRVQQFIESIRYDE